MTDNKLATTPPKSETTKWDAPLDLSNLSVTQMRFIGQMMADSDMFPDIAKDAAKSMVKILAGQEIGVTPFQSMSGINIIKGKAAMGANLIAGKIKGHPLYDYRADVSSDKCTVRILQRDSTHDKYEETGSFTFTMEDAKRIGLAGKDNWRNYPSNMLFARAITSAQRMYAPDVLNGGLVYDPDELGAVTNDQGSVVETAVGDNELSEAITKIEAAKDEDELTDIVTNLPATVQKNVTEVAGKKFKQLTIGESDES